MKVINSVVVLLAVMVLSGCLDSSPSESDAKEAVKNMYGNCDYISIENFKKINGVSRGEKMHSLDVTFTVKVTPPSVNQKMSEEYRVKRKAELEEMKQAEAERESISKKMWDDLKCKGSGLDWSSGSDLAEKCKALDKTDTSIATRINELERSLHDDRKIDDALLPLRNNIFNKCKMSPSVGSDLFTLGDKAQSLEEFSNGFTKDFSGTLTMIKTDNGWMLAK